MGYLGKQYTELLDVCFQDLTATMEPQLKLVLLFWHVLLRELLLRGLMKLFHPMVGKVMTTKSLKTSSNRSTRLVSDLVNCPPIIISCAKLDTCLQTFVYELDMRGKRMQVACGFGESFVYIEMIQKF